MSDKRESAPEVKELRSRLNIASKVNCSLEEQLLKAETIMKKYNDFLKEEYTYAKILGTDIDEYFREYEKAR